MHLVAQRRRIRPLLPPLLALGLDLCEQATTMIGVVAVAVGVAVGSARGVAVTVVVAVM